MAKKNQTGNAAAQVAAAPAAPSTETVNTATVATIVKAKKMPPKKRVAAAEKAPKESKRLTGVMVNIATVSYNHWREFVNAILNGEDKDAKKVARFVKDESALNTKWGGFIATSPENVDAVVAKMNAWNAENAARPEAEQFIDLWQTLEHFQTVEPKPRVRKAKAETTEAASTEATA